VKVCTRCLAEKPPEDFAWNGRGGRRPVCRVCTYSAKAKTESTKIQCGKRLVYKQVQNAHKIPLRHSRDGTACWCCRNKTGSWAPVALCYICKGER
jgi:hypothetical protein